MIEAAKKHKTPADHLREALRRRDEAIKAEKEDHKKRALKRLEKTKVRKEAKRYGRIKPSAEIKQTWGKNTINYIRENGRKNPIAVEGEIGKFFYDAEEKVVVWIPPRGVGEKRYYEADPKMRRYGKMIQSKQRIYRLHEEHVFLEG